MIGARPEPSTPMNTSFSPAWIPAPGTKVYFGRSHGEQTLGLVVKVNRSRAKVRQLDSRGTYRSYPVGTVWTVPFTLLTPAPPEAQPQGGTWTQDSGGACYVPPSTNASPERSAMQAEIERLRAENARLKAPKREEGAIIADIRGVYSALSPENLTCDGELPRYQVQRRAASLRARLRTLEAELGRHVSEDEAYRSSLISTRV